MMAQKVNKPPKHRLQLIASHCEVRDDRWSITIQDEGDNSVDIRVVHREYGDFYDWPENIFNCNVKAAQRAYDLTDNEVTFATLGRGKAAAMAFLKAYGAGEVEMLEWDVNSQSMVVVQHHDRERMPLWWPPAKADPLAPYCKGDNR